MARETSRIAAEIDSYASSEDFCGYFLKEMDSLYQLALLLTGNQYGAQQCIEAALQDCKRAKVFKPWLGSWSRLSVIERALKSETKSSIVAESASMELKAILQLDRLERVIYTLSVLEKYGVRDCAILLRLSKREISDAKVSALKDVSTFLAPLDVTQVNALGLGA